MASQGPLAGSAAANVPYTGSTSNWTNATNVFTSNNVYATHSSPSSLTSHYLQITGFGFSIAPTDIINGIEVAIERKANVDSTPSKFRDQSIKLVINGTASGDDKASTTTNWPTTDTTVTLGGSSDLWGLTLTPSDVNNSSFGIAISGKIYTLGGKTTVIGSIDYVTITVHYTSGVTPASVTGVGTITGINTITL